MRTTPAFGKRNLHWRKLQDRAGLPMYGPLVLSVAWLLGTYAVFLVLGQVGEVGNRWKLSIFVLATIASLATGYWLSITSRRRRPPVPQEPRTRMVRRITFASAIYVIVYSIALLAEYGATGPADIIRAVLSPGDAYFAKFAVYQRQQAEDADRVLQILTLLAVLYTPLVPYTIVFWRRLTPLLRGLSVFAGLLYASYFLFIGTMKGLGDLVIFAVTAILVVHASEGSRRERRQRSVRGVAAAALLLIAFVGYMAFNQADRLERIGANATFSPNPVVEALTNERFARGVSVVAFYPTHGYLGLSHNLDTSFEWTMMRGGSRAIDGYLAQYGFGPSVADETYPARTEARTGWPADMFWATAYPWLASDMTFPGVVLFMSLVGWWLARFWMEATIGQSLLALLLLSQIMLFIAFIPANNQIGIGRPTLIGFVTLVGLYVLNRLTATMMRGNGGRASQSARNTVSLSRSHPPQPRHTPSSDRA